MSRTPAGIVHLKLLPWQQLVRWSIFGVPLIFLCLFYFYPLARIVLLSLFPAGGWEAGELTELFRSQVYARILWFTTWQAALSTLLTVVLALPGAYIFARYNFFGKRLLLAIMTVPFVLPTVVTAAAFRALLGDNGLINDWLMAALDSATPLIRLDQTVSFFLLAHVFYNYSLVLRIVSGFWAGLDRNIQDAARMLGASPFQIFFKITLPQLLPAIGSAAMLVFIFCFTSFGVVLILGGARFATIEVEIYRQAVQLFQLPVAATLSLIQIGVNFLLMWIYARLDLRSKSGIYGTSHPDSTQSATGFGQRFMIWANVVFMVLLLGAPLIGLAFRSVMGSDGFTLAYYQGLMVNQVQSVFFVEPVVAVGNSLLFGLSAMLVALMLGLLASTFLASSSKRGATIWDAIIMLPLATSAVTLGFGYIISLNTPPLNLRNSPLLVVLAHSLVAFPFVVRCILPMLRRIPQRVREAAMLLGASPFSVWMNIDLPLIRRAALVGGVFAFSISMGEFGATAFVARPQTPTMPVAIFRFLGQPGEMNYGQAMAMATILMLVTCIGFWLIGLLEKGEQR